MKILPADGVIGTNIIYNDYLGYQRYGKIAWIEEYNGPENDDVSGGTIVWVYIVDDDPEYNVHEMILPADSKNGPRSFMYAEMRLSTEIILEEEN